MKYLGSISDNKDLINKEYVDSVNNSLTNRTRDVKDIDLLWPSKRNSGVNNGITFTWSEDKTTCYVSGTSGSSTARNYFLGGTNAIPPAIIPGKTYLVKVNSTSTKVYLQFLFFLNGAYTSQAGFTNNSQITIPEGITGIYISVSVSANTQLQDTQSITFSVLSSESADIEVVNKNQEDISDIKTILTASGIVVYKHADIYSPDTEHEYELYSSDTSVTIDYKRYGCNLKLECNPTYSIDYVNRTTEEYTTILSATTSQTYICIYAPDDEEIAFVVRKTEGNSSVSFEDVINNVFIEPYEFQWNDYYNGLKSSVIDFFPNLFFDKNTCTFVVNPDKAVSLPIKIPETGVRISVNPDRYKLKQTQVPFRVFCVHITHSGFSIITEEENEDLYDVTMNNITSSSEPVYIPYVPDTYVIIQIGTYNSDESVLKNGVIVYSGDINKRGKLLGLHPMRVFVTQDSQTYPTILNIKWGTKDYIINTSRYYGGFLWLKYAKEITVSPKYTIVANIYKLNDNDTVTRMESIFTNDIAFPNGTTEANSDLARVSGVNHIDLTKYDFDGFILFAIQNTVEYRKRSVVNTQKEQLGMGVMHNYVDVYNNVFVNYYNDYETTVEQGLPSVLFENINDYMNYTFPLRLGSEYVHEWEAGSEGHVFTPIEDATPAFYAGTYDANSLFLNIIGESYYTGMYNINSRCYQFAYSDSDYGRYGYGLTCTDFCAVLLGLKENYPSECLALTNPMRFDLITSTWDYTKDMDILQPGDILTEWKIMLDGGEGEGEYTEAHCMIVYEKKYVNGQLECVIVIEAGYPYTRFTTLYNDKYVPATGSFPSIRRLENYNYISRLKPEYLNKIKKSFDLKTTYRPGTIMCDRGSHSIYGINPVDGADPEGAWELESPELLLTITDDEATNVSIFKDGQLLTTVSIGSETKNGYRVLDIKSYITEGGLYTLKTDTSEDIQETFWVQEPYDMDIQTSGTTKTVHFSHKDQIRYVCVFYNKYLGIATGGTKQGEPVYADVHKIYVPEEVETDSPQEGKPYDETWGKVNIPATLDDGSTYKLVKLIYGTEYGTFQQRWVSVQGTLIPFASVEYSPGGRNQIPTDD